MKNVLSASLIVLTTCVASSSTAVATMDDDPILALTGIYVEFYTPNDLCPGNPSLGDGWAPVASFPNRGATCPNTTPANGVTYGSNITFSASAGVTYRVFAVDSSQSIGSITVNGSGYTLLVGRAGAQSVPPFTSLSTALPVAGGGSIGAINASGGIVQGS